MIELALSIIIALSLGVIALFVYKLVGRRSQGEEIIRLPTVVFCLWLVAAAFWGPYFFSIHISGFFDISIDRLLFLALIFIMAAGIIKGELAYRQVTAIEFLMFCFIAVCFASMLRHGWQPEMPQFPSPWFIFMSGYLFPFLAFVFAKHYLVRERDMFFVFRTLFFIGVYLAILSFFEFWDLRQFVFPRYINDTGIWLHLDRARGPFLNAAFNGVALIIAFICGFHLLPTRTGLKRASLIAILLLFFPAVFFAQTRSVYLSFLIALVALFAFYRAPFPKWKLLSLPIALIMVFVFLSAPRILSPERRTGGIMQMKEVELRLGLVKRSLGMFVEHPFFGVGLARFIPASVEEYRGRFPIAEGAEQQVQHNHMLGLMVELGVIGAGIYALIVLTFFRRLYQLADIIPEKGAVSANTLLLIAVAMTVYLVNNNFLEPAYCLFLNAVFFTLGGITDGLKGIYVGGLEDREVMDEWPPEHVSARGEIVRERIRSGNELPETGKETAAEMDIPPDQDKPAYFTAGGLSGSRHAAVGTNASAARKKGRNVQVKAFILIAGLVILAVLLSFVLNLSTLIKSLF